MKRIKNALTLILMLAAVFSAAAQGTSTVTGTVLDKDGAVIGATVVVKNTTNGTATDIDGNFVLKNVDAQKGVLVVTYVGYQPQEVALKGRTEGIEVFMTEDTSMLEEMVVIGYARRKEVILPVQCRR